MKTVEDFKLIQIGRLTSPSLAPMLPYSGFEDFAIGEGYGLHEAIENALDELTAKNWDTQAMGDKMRLSFSHENIVLSPTEDDPKPDPQYHVSIHVR